MAGEEGMTVGTLGDTDLGDDNGDTVNVRDGTFLRFPFDPAGNARSSRSERGEQRRAAKGCGARGGQQET